MRNLPAYLPTALLPAARRSLLWVQTHLLIWSSVIQLGILAAVLLLFRLTLPPTRRFLGAHAAAVQNPVLNRITRVLVGALPWLLLALLLQIIASVLLRTGQPDALLRLAVSLVLAWSVIGIVYQLVSDPRVAKIIAAIAWIIAALNILGLLTPTSNLLNQMAVNVGTLHLSVLLVLKAVAVLFIAIWLANLLSRALDARLRTFPDISPAMQVLAAKLTRAALLTIAVLLALGTVGIDLTAFAVFSGAVGVGLGFGLQKVFSNLISGVILLLDSSIKPGDVIELTGTYGWITQLNARYVSLVTRDGTEHLIPNEDLITQRVVNWTYSNERVRIRVPVGVSYNADLREVRPVCIEAAKSVDRVLSDPPPVCLVDGFGDSTINLDLRFWINDPRAGVANVKSDVLMAVWEHFRDAGIELPFPQRDLHVIEPITIRRAPPNPTHPDTSQPDLSPPAA
jgi:small-conductance mechanosensitive channel